MTAEIFAVKRFAVHDGDGIRTTVFFKGCPLRCVWCHNPEGLAPGPQLAFYAEKCTNCGLCAEVCPRGAHRIIDGQHRFERSLCTACGACADLCPARVLTLYGETVTVDSLLPRLLEDRAYYEKSVGGVTLSGGECLCQADFCAELLARLHQHGIHTAVDTCGAVPRAALEKVIPFTDLFLYDLKAHTESVHQRCTGRPNGLILDNLRWLDEVGAVTEVRIPFVPGFNTDEVPALAALLAELRHLRRVHILPYHNFAGAKYAALDYPNTMPATLPERAELDRAISILRAAGLRAD